jgi:hypothetical protein
VKKLTKKILEKVEGQVKVKFTLVQFILGLLKPFLTALREIEVRLRLVLGILA